MSDLPQHLAAHRRRLAPVVRRTVVGVLLVAACATHDDDVIADPPTRAQLPSADPRPLPASGIEIRGGMRPLTWLGDTLQLRVVTPAGTEKPGKVRWRSLDAAVADVDDEGVVRAMSSGSTSIIALTDAGSDTLIVQVIQRPARLEAARLNLVARIGDTLPLPWRAVDSGGTEVVDTPISVRAVGEELLSSADGWLTAILPGHTRLEASVDGLTSTVDVRVLGVVLVADGNVVTQPGSILGARDIEVRNSRLRLRWHPGVWERGGLEVDSRSGLAWLPATTRGHGDWLYVASTVVTEPTQVDVITLSDSLVGVRMRFGDHRFRPQVHGFPDTYREQAYPFSRTFWLARGEDGYFSWVQLDSSMTWQGIEHEIGFGGVFGPGRIRTADDDFAIEAQSGHRWTNPGWKVDAAEFRLTGDPLVRVLVPLPGMQMITPVFPGFGSGSVYVHNPFSQSYGAYLYAAPATRAQAARTVCGHAWERAPFALPRPTDAELAACGPPPMAVATSRARDQEEAGGPSPKMGL